MLFTDKSENGNIAPVNTTNQEDFRQENHNPGCSNDYQQIREKREEILKTIRNVQKEQQSESSPIVGKVIDIVI